MEHMSGAAPFRSCIALISTFMSKVVCVFAAKTFDQHEAQIGNGDDKFFEHQLSRRIIKAWLNESPDHEVPEGVDPEHLARFNRVMSALIAVPKEEAFAAYLKEEFSTPKGLASGGSIVDVDPNTKPSPTARTAKVAIDLKKNPKETK
jgi:hypothetical protein